MCKTTRAPASSASLSSVTQCTELHPFGMLDRDQRTIFTFSPIKSTAKIDQPYNFNKSSINQNNINNKSKNHIKWIACDTTTARTTTTTTAAAAADRLCDKKMCCTIHRNNNIKHIQSEHKIHHHAQMHCHHSSSCDGVGQLRQHQCYRSVVNLRRHTVQYLRTKLSDYILICFCIWFLTLPQTLASPTNFYMMQSRSLESKLQFPCGVNYIATKEDLTPADLKGLFNIIHTQTKIAWDQADKDIKNYLETTWKIQLNEFHQLWKHKKMDWLYPIELDKQMTEELPPNVADYFKTSAQALNQENFQKLLTDCDDRLQRLIIGFHAIIDDHKSRVMKMDKQKYEELLGIFQSASMHMMQVLCEVRTTSQKMGIKPKLLDESVMSEKSKTDNFRDWIIFREYVNQLEWMRDVFGIVQNNILI